MPAVEEFRIPGHAERSLETFRAKAKRLGAQHGLVASTTGVAALRFGIA